MVSIKYTIFSLLLAGTLAACGGGGGGSPTSAGAATDPASTPPAAPPSAPPTSTADQSCAAANFTVANFNAINAGMSLAQVSQVIGCKVTTNTVLQSKIIYTWTSGSSLINVDFDPAGNAVTSNGGTFKVASNLQFADAPSAPTCSAGNFTIANFNAVKLGMTAAQANQAIGCQSNGNTLLQSKTVLTWTSGSSSIQVDFDADATTITTFGGPFKVAAGLANPPTTVTAICTGANFTVTNFNAIANGMSLEQVSQTIGCKVTSIDPAR